MSKLSSRSSAERQAEAAVYRARTEAAAIPTIDLSKCEYDKSRKVLKLASEYIGMPLTFFVKSHRTGRMVRFVPVTIVDPLYDQDNWDGEQQIYRPVKAEMNTNVDHMVIYNQW